jgi:tripartite-type tricarboxylate transporter receptor subunit TctC
MRAVLPLFFSALLAAAAFAADPYPFRPIKLLIPFLPAGITDLSGRLVAEGLRAKFNQPVISENKPGANGVLGLRELLKAEPDGYTRMVGNLGSLVINYAMDVNAPFDPMRDVVPIAGTSEYERIRATTCGGLIPETSTRVESEEQKSRGSRSPAQVEENPCGKLGPQSDNALKGEQV